MTLVKGSFREKKGFLSFPKGQKPHERSKGLWKKGFLSFPKGQKPQERPKGLWKKVLFKKTKVLYLKKVQKDFVIAM
ncbi:hypothetical protein CEXT_517571 [Caerostris extrusa]|uniref:Uncharacterized protein n=1 Tax=Caerostris extrusa TaxID=172846 RepID=A0AAV4NTK4_CAEEX|nr:hypothetical protein CEXT_517571 [Caerostris extrusa]